VHVVLLVRGKMKVLSRVALLCIMLFFLIGCKPTGYEVELSVDSARLSDIEYVEGFLKKEGFQILTYDATGKGNVKEWREREVSAHYPGEVYTALMKRISDREYSWVEIYIYYVKDQEDSATHVLFRIGNAYSGLIDPQVKAKINNISQSLYEGLSERVGRERLIIKRQEVVSPVGRLGW
jgi:hypothetical protein